MEQVKQIWYRNICMEQWGNIQGVHSWKNMTEPLYSHNIFRKLKSLVNSSGSEFYDVPSERTVPASRLSLQLERMVFITAASVSIKLWSQTGWKSIFEYTCVAVCALH